MKISKIPPPGNPISTAARGETNLPVRILFVEDDNSIRQLSSTALRHSGYHVDAAEDGSAGWEALEARCYDLLITDNNMPKVSGVELVKMVCSARMTLPVVMASGTIPTEALNRDSSLQLEATLLKPSTMEELLGTVEEALCTAEVSPSHTVSFPAMAGAA
jgi:two-component system chemotaxis response regulator CheY